MSKFHSHILNSLAYTFLQKGKRENLKFIDKLIKEKKQDLKRTKEQQILEFIGPKIACFLFLESLAQFNYPPLRK